MSGVESLLHGSWSWLLNCDAMTDVVLLQTVYKVLRRKHIWVVLDSQREGVLVEMVNTGHLVGPVAVLKAAFCAVCIFLKLESLALVLQTCAA